MANIVQHQPPTPERFFNAINAYQQTEAIKAAVELEVFTAIAEGNATAEKIAKRCHGRNVASGFCVTFSQFMAS